MRRESLLAMLLLAFALVGRSPSSASPTEGPADTCLALPATDQACSSFCLDNGDHCVFGTNQDNRIDAGLLYVNKRGLLKSGWDPSTSGQYARWIAKYGSVTIVHAGYQMAWAGMNEAGLMFSTMSLGETRNPLPDQRPPLVSSLWAQYQLDNHSTVEEVIASDSQVRIADTVDHYLICDGKGDCATIEFLDGKMVYHTGQSLPVKALTNSTYEESLRALETKESFPVEILFVFPDGPAMGAGLMAGDRIMAVDGLELSGGQSLEDFFQAIEGRQVGDEVTFSLQRPGNEEPFTAVVEMSAPPPDDGRLQIPESFPRQILSLGFLPSVPGDFLLRFATAASWVESFEPAGPEDAVPYAFETLQAVSRHDTAWSIVFDPANLRVHFRTHSNPQIRYLDLGALDFSCRTPVMMLDIHADLSGDIKDDLVPYSHRASLDHLLGFLERYQRVDLHPFVAEALLRGLERFPCKEGDAAAMESAGACMAAKSLLPTRVAWIAVAVLQRVWPVWIALTLLSLTFVVPRLARSQVVSWRGRWVWVFVVALLGPFGLLVYLLAYRTGGH